MTDFGIHRCKGIRVKMHMPDNANCIVLTVDHVVTGHDKNYAPVELPERSDITLYDLPKEVTDILLEHFGNPNETEEAA